MVLPDLESSAVLMIRFTKKATPELLTLIRERLVSGGIQILSQENDNGGGGDAGGMIWSLTTSQDEVQVEAEYVHMVKPTFSLRTNILEYFTVASQSLFRLRESPDQRRDYYQSDIFRTTGRRRRSQRKKKLLPNADMRIVEYDADGIFSSADRAMLAWSVLGSVNVLEPGVESSNLSRALDQLHISYLHRRHYDSSMRKSRSLFGNNNEEDDDDDNDDDDDDETENKASSSSSSSQSRAARGTVLGSSSSSSKKNPPPLISSSDAGSSNKKQNQDNNIDELTSESLRHVLLEHGLADVISPIHIPRLRDSIMRETWRLTTGPPMEAIRTYYGEEVAFYFAWIHFYTLWLLGPGLFGTAIYFIRNYRGDTVDTCDLTPLHGLVTFLWAVLFCRYWDRQENRLAYQWGTFASTTGYQRKFFNTRLEFDGTLRISPVTGLLELYYPPNVRRLQYLVSALVTLVLLAGAFQVMIFSLNLQGYVDPQHNPGRWSDENPHPFYYPWLAQFAKPGQLFDMESVWRPYLPVVLHVAVVMSMNLLYRHVAEALTRWENHETDVSFQNSLIMKRFLFEAFDAYIILFYLAFYEHDIRKLRMELVSVFNVDTFRRVAVECILPVVMQKLSGSHHHKQKQHAQDKFTDGPILNYKKTDGDNTAMGSEASLYSSNESTRTRSLPEEAARDEYEEFDDYLEIIIQLGYVTLFASAYPLAAFVAIFANLIEIRTDMFKLARVCRRPVPRRTDSLGTWKTVMVALVWMSALTNCLIFGYTSKQLLQWMPEYFTLHPKDGHHQLVPGKAHVIVLVVFGLERALVLVGLALDAFVPSLPEDVVIWAERRQYIRAQETNRLRFTSGGGGSGNDDDGDEGAIRGSLSMPKEVTPFGVRAAATRGIKSQSKLVMEQVLETEQEGEKTT